MNPLLVFVWFNHQLISSSHSLTHKWVLMKRKMELMEQKIGLTVQKMAPIVNRHLGLISVWTNMASLVAEERRRGRRRLQEVTAVQQFHLFISSFSFLRLSYRFTCSSFSSSFLTVGKGWKWLRDSFQRRERRRKWRDTFLVEYAKEEEGKRREKENERETEKKECREKEE